MSLSDELCRSYLDLRWHFDPAAGTVAGVAELDGRLGQYDDQSVREHLAAFRAIEAGVEELEVEDAADELDRTALLDDIRVAIFRLQHEQPYRRNPAFWLRHLCDALYSVLPQPGEPPEARAGVALARLQAVPDFLRSAAATLVEPPEPLIEAARALLDPAAALVTRLSETVTAPLEDGTAELVAAAADAEAALARFRLMLDTDLSAHADQHAVAVGPDQFERLLHHLHAVRAGASELWRYVLHLDEETEGRLCALERELPTGSGWGAFVQRSVVEARGVDGVAAARAELERIERFLATVELVHPEPSSPAVRPLPDHRVPVTGHAGYQVGVQAAQAVQGVLWIAPWPSTAAWISPVVAEVGVPGQHIQAARAARLPAEIRRHLSAGLPRSGWGLYALELLEEAGYWPTPVEQLMVRSHLLLRVLLARIDIGIHTRRMAPEEAERLLVDRLSLEPEHAQAMVFGVCFEPSLAIGALIGRRELLRLRDERRQAAGAGFVALRHHEEVLSFGNLPVPLIRWGMGLEE